jgi:hypothetical protein
MTSVKCARVTALYGTLDRLLLASDDASTKRSLATRHAHSVTDRSGRGAAIAADILDRLFLAARGPSLQVSFSLASLRKGQRADALGV